MMGLLIAMMVPLALLWMGFAGLTGRSLGPQAVLRSVTSLLWRAVRLLWRERHQRSGGGRLDAPRLRYRQPPRRRR